MTIESPLRVRVYRARFTPLAVNELLDPRQVKKARGLAVEVGTIAAAGKSATLVAELDRGMVTRLSVQGCAGCDPGRQRRRSAAETRTVISAIADNERRIRGGLPSLPVPFAQRVFAGKDIFIPIFPVPPIVIIIEPDTWCVAVRVPGKICVCCPDLGCRCI